MTHRESDVLLLQIRAHHPEVVLGWVFAGQPAIGPSSSSVLSCMYCVNCANPCSLLPGMCDTCRLVFNKEVLLLAYMGIHQAQFTCTDLGWQQPGQNTI